MELKEKCPVCDTKADTWLTDHANITHYKCPRCGNFYYVWTSIDLENKTVDRPLLSHWLRTHQSKKPIELTKELVNTILTNTSLPKPKEQADNFILWMGKSARTPNEDIIEKYNIIAAIIGATDEHNVRYIEKHLYESGFIKSFPDSGGGYQGHLTFKGWERYDELLHATTESRNAFMAMTFGNDKLNQLFKDIIKPSIAETGFNLKRLDDEPKAGIIDNLLRVEIRKSKFLLVDLTTDNRGAYWEAGFAEGLGKEVIYICEKTKFDDKENPVHFDTHHLQTVTFDWNELDEFVTQLKATIRATFPNDANMED